MDKFFDKLDKINERLNSMDRTLIKQEENLKEHMRRSELAEKSIELLKTELKPVQAHVLVVGFVFRFTLALVSIIGTISAVIHYWR